MLQIAEYRKDPSLFLKAMIRIKDEKERIELKYRLKKLLERRIDF